MVALGEKIVPTGQELLAEFIQYGNQKPFEEIVRRYAGMVFNTCFRVTKDKHEAEDATQAVFLTLALQARRGADIKALGPWLQQVAKRLSLDTRRSKKRRKTREERHHAEQLVRRESILDDTLPSADMDELKTILHEELQKLPAKYRLPLILHYFGGLSREEMAAELNCKPSTLGVRIFRGREMLAGRLSGRGINISLGVLAVAMGYVVRRAVSESVIASTSHAATAIMAGYDGSGFASANVIGLTRRATSALTLGKVRLAALTMMMAGTSLGAGAKALGVLPQINLQQLISNQMNRIIRPLFTPFSLPMRVDARTVAPAEPKSLASATSVAPVVLTSLLTQTPTAAVAAAPVSQLIAPVKTSVDSDSLTIDFANSPLQSVFNRTAASPSKSADEAHPPAAGSQDRSPSVATIDSVDTAGASGESTAAAGGSAAGLLRQSTLATPRPVVTATPSLPDVALFGNDLVVGSVNAGNPAGRSSINASMNASISAGASAAAQIAVIQIPALNGLVTESSNGQLRGYGTITRTGSLTINPNGMVIADGSGVDRTLNLRSITSIVDASSSTASSNPTLASVNTATSNAVNSANSSSAASGSGASNTANSNRPLPGNGSSTLSGLSGTTTYAQNAAAANLTAMTESPTPTLNPNGGSAFPSSVDTAGWYAVNHGRLSLSLESGSDKSVFTWGEDPASTRLNLVNSVRLNLEGQTAGASGTADASAPTALSLLASDRSDVPDLSQMFGVPIGIWEVDPSSGSLTDASISICYDGLLADELGASPSSIDLWTLGGPGSTWQPVDPSTLLVDTSDDLISGYAPDVSYFAVAVTPAPGTDVSQLVAHHLSQVGSKPTPFFTSALTAPVAAPEVVPEPTTLMPLLAGAALLSRRRRNKSV